MERWLRFVIGVAGCTGLLHWGCGAGNAAGPSFHCSKVTKGSIEAMVCADEGLAGLDRDLTAVYVQAIAQVGEEHSSTLKAEQRGWIKGRNDCWKSDDKHACVRDQYILRIAELQARYRLVTMQGPVSYRCNDEAATEIITTYFTTDPPTLIAERGDQVSLMYQKPSGSGARYVGRNESLWEHQGEVMITWGYDAPEMQCRPASASRSPGSGKD